MGFIYSTSLSDGTIFSPSSSDGKSHPNFYSVVHISRTSAIRNLKKCSSLSKVVVHFIRGADGDHTSVGREIVLIMCEMSYE